MSDTSFRAGEPHTEHPERWCLDLSVGDTELQYILYAPGQNGSLHTHTLVLDSGLSPLQAIESAVYDHSELLDDYGRVRVVLHSPHFALLPPAVGADGDLPAEVLAANYPDDDGDQGLCHLPQCDIDIAYTMPRGIVGFVQRTFNNPPVVHHLYPLCEHFFALNRGASIARMFVGLHEGSLDVALFRNGRLVMANTLPMRNTADATYMILHTWQSLGLDVQRDELQLTGDKALRDALAPELRRFVKYVMPTIFPARALALGDEALRAPLDLILLASCE